MIISRKLRESAKGQECTMQVAGICNENPETSVLAHIQVEGGIMGGKTDDVSACIACSSCHEWLDQHRGSELDELFYTRRAMVRTHLFWIERKLLVVR